MKLTFNQYLTNDLLEGFISSLQEEDILSILTTLKKKVNDLLKEENLDANKVDHYLKVVAMFEQLFRFLASKKINPADIVGFNTLVGKNDMDTTSEETLELGIEKILNAYNEHRMINFKQIVEKRFNDFKNWLFGKNKEDLEIVQGAIDFTISSIQRYNQDLRMTRT